MREREKAPTLYLCFYFLVILLGDWWKSMEKERMTYIWCSSI